MTRLRFLPIFLLIVFPASSAHAAEPTISIDTPMSPPAWALLERELLRANAEACREFFAKYFDERGWLLCVERWGGDDGPDDAIENCNDWPLLSALGAPDVVQEMTKKAWEGHLRQYTLAKTVDVPFARDGMYYKEFPVMFDWLHNGEGLTVFNLMGLNDPVEARFQQRVRRYAGFYLGEDPGAPNYDARYKIIKSLFNGSRGPLLRKATALDWAGDPIEVENRFRLGHGEKSYAEMIEHFKDYNDIVGDHPSNLLTTSLALNAYMLTHEVKYKKWLLDYVDAWRERTIANKGIIPTNIGLDGTIGGAAGGKWYGGVYGWGFSVYDPASKKVVNRNQQYQGFIGFMNAYMLTGDDRYLDVWRKQIDAVNANQKQVDGKTMYPHMYGDQGWYDYTPQKYDSHAFDIAYLTLQPADVARVAGNAWLEFLASKQPAYAESVLRRDLARIRERVAGMRNDPTTPDTRLADDPMAFNPASVQSLVELTLGGMMPVHNSSVLNCRLRYFDPAARRAGLPPDVAALVDSMTADSATVTLVNVNQLESRTLIIQAGGYAEHEFVSVNADGPAIPAKSPHVTVHLSPGAGARVTLQMRRYANQPTMRFPW
ncbi:MAG: hypothetical protein HY290_30115 [Planctomycetia bacterium]|nr:hypothetical protein [Planctomycetia bacterium]